MVDIRIKNAGEFQDVALLVDQDKFINYSETLRTFLKIILDPSQPNYAYSAMPFKDDNYKNRLKLGKKYALTNKQIHLFAEWFADDSVFAYLYKNRSPYYFTDALRDASIHLLTIFKKTDNFLPAIQAAIAINIIREEDYKSCIFTEYSRNIADTSTLPLPDREKYKIPQEGVWNALFFQDYTTREEIDELLDNEFNKRQKKDSKVSRSIQLHRKWYWDYKRLGSYNNVAKSYQNNSYSADTIYKGIAAYKRLLSIAKKSD